MANTERGADDETENRELPIMKTEKVPGCGGDRRKNNSKEKYRVFGASVHRSI